MGRSIVIVGSLNMDFVVQMETLPQPGQTVPGWGFQLLPGGKGANQACSVGKLGGRGRMVGRVGEDVFGKTLRESLGSAGVDTSHVLATRGEASGVALIFVQKGGQNEIVVAAGSNGRLLPEDLKRAESAFEPGGWLLLQLETPIETVEAAATIARSRGMRVILDPAPARPLPKSLLAQVDILTPNESEAKVLLHEKGGAVDLAEAPVLASELRKLGPRTVILKMGEKGAFHSDASGSGHHPTRRVEAIDATAAGDTFNGALAVALAEEKSLPEAIRFANAAASISVTRLGAQTSVPTRAEVDAALAAWK